MSKTETPTLFSLAAIVKALAETVERFEQRLCALEATATPAIRALNLDHIVLAIEADPYVRFEILENWTYGQYHFSAGQILRADQLPHIKDLIKLGLKLARPIGQEAYLEQVKQDTGVMLANAQAQAMAARTALAEVDAMAAKMTLEADDLVASESA